MINFEQKTKRDIYFKLLEKENKRLIDQKTGLLAKKYSNFIECPLCAFNRFKKLFIKNGFTFVRCLKCKLVYVNPQVNEYTIKSFYSSSKANNFWFQIMCSKTEKKWKAEYYKDALRLIEKHCSKNERSFLDVGCGNGQFMKIASKAGWNIEGVELNKKSVEFIKATYGYTVYNTEITEAPLKDNFYNVITMFGVLEHLNNPIQVLKFLKKKLKKEGILLAITPNVYSLYSMLLREKSKTFDGRNHLIYFSRETLLRLFKSLRFSVVSLDTVLTGKENIFKYIQFYEPYEPINNLYGLLDKKFLKDF